MYQMCMQQCIARTSEAALASSSWPASSTRFLSHQPQISNFLNCRQCYIAMSLTFVGLLSPLGYPQVHTLIPSMPLRPRENIHSTIRADALVYNINHVQPALAAMSKQNTPFLHHGQFDRIARERPPVSRCRTVEPSHCEFGRLH